MNGLAALLLTFTPAPDWTKDTDTQEIGHRAFDFPLSVDPDKRDKIDCLRLFVSQDGGNTWKRVGECKPDEARIGFKAEKDGVYWFTIQVVYKDGKKEPAHSELKPSMKIRINAKKEEPETTEIGSRSFALPVTVDPTRRDKIDHIRFFVSEDEGKTWKRFDEHKPEDGRVTFTAERDGVFWFTLQTVDKDGKREPKDGDLKPIQKVRINTAKAVVKRKIKADEVVATARAVMGAMRLFLR